MHDIRAIRDDPAAFDRALARRSLPPIAERLIALDETRRAAILELQKAQERRNAASKEIGAAMARKDAGVAEALRQEVAKLKLTMPEMESAEKSAAMLLDNELAAIPNLPASDTPDGKDENDLFCGVGDRRDGVGGEDGERGLLVEALVVEAVGGERAAEEQPLDAGYCGSGHCSWRAQERALVHSDQGPAIELQRRYGRAGDRTRTGDVQLGKLAFYQLNYARVQLRSTRCS